MPAISQMCLTAVVGYLVGSLSFAILVARARGVDIRSVGSGNPGATNVKRALGRGAGNFVFLLDFLKGFLPALWPMLVFANGSGLLSILGLTGAILGHSFPVYYGFKGGKGVATTMGGLLALMPVVMLIGILAWSAVFYIFRLVSVASIAFGLVLPLAGWGIQAWRPGWFVNILNKGGGAHQAEIVFAILISLLILVRHRANIARLLRGEELSFKKKE
jgi:glycerol-3-phosphate acyltransferase PlsY